MRIIHKYIIKEFFPPFLLALLLFTFVLLMDKIFSLVNLILTRGISGLMVLKLLAWFLPSLLSLTIPMGVLVGCIISFGRLSQANEITALKAAGIRIEHIMLPILLISIGLSSLLVYFNYNLVPFSHHAFRNLYYKVVSRSPTIKFQERTFLEIENSRLFVTSVDNKNHLLKGIIVYEFNPPSSIVPHPSSVPPFIITAPRGRWESISDTNIILQLFNGTIYQSGADLSRTSQLAFENYTINLNLNKESARVRHRSVQEFSGQELKKEIKHLQTKGIPASSLAVEYNLRGALAWACLCFGFLGMCVGTKSRRGAKPIGFGIGLIFIFLYYLTVILGITLGEKGISPPSVSVWLGNFVILGISVFLFLKISKY